MNLDYSNDPDGKIDPEQLEAAKKDAEEISEWAILGCPTDLVGKMQRIAIRNFPNHCRQAIIDFFTIADENFYPTQSLIEVNAAIAKMDDCIRKTQYEEIARYEGIFRDTFELVLRSRIFYYNIQVEITTKLVPQMKTVLEAYAIHEFGNDIYLDSEIESEFRNMLPPLIPELYVSGTRLIEQGEKVPIQRDDVGKLKSKEQSNLADAIKVRSLLVAGKVLINDIEFKNKTHGTEFWGNIAAALSDMSALTKMLKEHIELSSKMKKADPTLPPTYMKLLHNVYSRVLSKIPDLEVDRNELEDYLNLFTNFFNQFKELLGSDYKNFEIDETFIKHTLERFASKNS